MFLESIIFKFKELIYYYLKLLLLLLLEAIDIKVLSEFQVFTSIALFNMLIAPLNAFPWVLNGLMEAWISLRRIEDYINQPEIKADDYYVLRKGKFFQNHMIRLFNLICYCNKKFVYSIFIIIHIAIEKFILIILKYILYIFFSHNRNCIFQIYASLNCKYVRLCFFQGKYLLHKKTS